MIVRAFLFLLFALFSSSFVWSDVEDKFGHVISECAEGEELCQMSILKIADEMERLQKLVLTYARSTPAVTEYVSKSESVMQPLLNVQNEREAKEFRGQHLDQLRELHNLARELAETLPRHELQHWADLLSQPFS